MTTTPTSPTGLGEPRGPEYVSPDLDLIGGGAGPPGGPGRGRRSFSTAGWRRAALVGAAVVLVSAASGGLAGGLVARQENGAGAPSPTPSAAAGGLSGDMINAAKNTLDGVVSVEVRAADGSVSGGSGFALDGNQNIVTNDHTLGTGEPKAVYVETPSGRRIQATLVGRDPDRDIAVLKVPPSTGLRPLPLAKTGTTQVGEPVIAVGSPLGLSGTVTAGIVSALDREVKLPKGRRQTAIQTDASINPGNSGGPLVNGSGEVVGVNTAIASLEGGGSIGIGFAIPIEQASQAADRIIAGGG
ncbi:Trypsin-like peptidase domain-containing protein [Asanoa hainanensis]|uniref:Trypsin-like peptidase domain-containing protein n=1 Tax=Asanoa hainanensis TaxID=560556 RepID=A0A239PE18_9ACTN|nr:trypsin-like peptidase domain-containing protein [Asanoa hainanensis]SNT65311.1 Trypsin-like peptidase domain-containing protein [Asanoa hainanensis]